MFRGRTEGFREAAALLAALPAKVGAEKAQVAIHLAAEPTAEAARGFCPRGTATSNRFQRKKHGLGHLADAIRVFDLPPEGGTVRVAVSYPKAHFYGHFVEWGTAPQAPRAASAAKAYLRRSKKTGELKVGRTRALKARRGHPGTRARPFLRPAWDATKDGFLGLFGEYLWPALKSAMPGR